MACSVATVDCVDCQTRTMGKLSSSTRLRLEQAAPTETHYEGIQKDAFAYTMLKKMGWEEGKGLGSKESGISTHIRVKKREDGIGERRFQLKIGIWSDCDRRRRSRPTPRMARQHP